MIPVIGLLLCAYVAFRALEAMLNIAHGGAYADMGEGVQCLLILLGIALLVVCIACGYDLIAASKDVESALSPLARFGAP